MTYRHLLSDAAENLPTVLCGYWDDVRETSSLADVLKVIETLFADSGQEPAMVDVRERGQKSARRQSYRSFLRKGANIEIDEISVHARDSDPMAQTWTPPAFATFQFNDRVNFVGLYASHENIGLLDSEQILRMAARLDAGAAYRFSYPLAFSPVAYMSRLSFSPNERRFGSVTDTDSLRVANYRDHCWRGMRAHDGFVRDIYDLVVLNDLAANRTVGRSSLREWVTADQGRGSWSKEARFSLWTLGSADPVTLQESLDKERILLAGFGPDD